MTPPTGQDPKVTCAPQPLIMLKSNVQSMWKATGGLFSNIFLRIILTVIITIPKLPDQKLARPPIQLADFQPPVTNPNALKNTCTTACYLWTPVTPTVDSLLIPTSCHLLALAIFPKLDPHPQLPLPKPLNPPQKLLQLKDITFTNSTSSNNLPKYHPDTFSWHTIPVSPSLPWPSPRRLPLLDPPIHNQGVMLKDSFTQLSPYFKKTGTELPFNILSRLIFKQFGLIKFGVFLSFRNCTIITNQL